MNGDNYKENIRQIFLLHLYFLQMTGFIPSENL